MHHGRTAMGAVPRLENGWAFGPWGFDSLSFRSRSGVVDSVRRATVTRERQVRALPPELLSACPRGRSGDDAGPSTRKLRVRVPPGVSIDRQLAVGEMATPPASGAGDRRFDSCRPDLVVVLSAVEERLSSRAS